MEHSKTFVFKEFAINNAILFLWYKLADENNLAAGIIPDKILTWEEHYAALMYD